MSSVEKNTKSVHRKSIKDDSARVNVWVSGDLNIKPAKTIPLGMEGGKSLKRANNVVRNMKYDHRLEVNGSARMNVLANGNLITCAVKTTMRGREERS